jgi:hypothetical protein
MRKGGVGGDVPRSGSGVQLNSDRGGMHRRSRPGPACSRDHKLERPREPEGCSDRPRHWPNGPYDLIRFDVFLNASQAKAEDKAQEQGTKPNKQGATVASVALISAPTKPEYVPGLQRPKLKSARFSCSLQRCLWTASVVLITMRLGTSTASR